MQLYKVKLKTPQESQPDHHINGYLGCNDTLGIYTRGEALKKARMFNGKIEKHGRTFSIVQMSMATMCTGELHPTILKELDGREQFTDTDDELGEKIYGADVFDAILEEQSETPEEMKLPQDILDQLELLSLMTANYSYILLVK